MEKPDRGLGWKYDLPAPNAEAIIDTILKEMPRALTTVNENYLELSRVSLKLRGGWIVLAVIMSAMALEGTIDLFSDLLVKSNSVGLELILLHFCFFTAMFCLLTPYIRMDFGFPKNEPIRFNRQRRKVYFYQYRFNLLNPFGRKGWGVKPVAYHWDDLTLEAYRIYAPGYGGLKEEVKISICKPGTTEIIDRVYFTDDIEQGEQFWAIVRLFMQQGPEAIPDFLHPTADKIEIANPNLEKKAVSAIPSTAWPPTFNGPPKWTWNPAPPPIKETRHEARDTCRPPS